MKNITFEKYQGDGNDFVVIDSRGYDLYKNYKTNNIFDIKSKRLLWRDESYPTLADLDNESLTAVWSSGECVNIKT